MTKSAPRFFELDRKLSLQPKFRSCKPWELGQSHGVVENTKLSKVKSGSSKKNGEVRVRRASCFGVSLYIKHHSVRPASM